MSSEHQCTVTQDGVCALHNVSEERRQQTDRKTDVIPSMLTRINFMLGYAFMASLVIAGMFYYTQETRAEATARDLDLKQTLEQISRQSDKKIVKNADQITKLTTAIAKGEEKHNALMEKVDLMMDYMVLLINTKHPEMIHDSSELK